MKSPKRVAIIGTGISGMAAAIELADKGMRVTAFEKNASYGGRGRQHLAQGYAFDLGPSWYWMPDIFEAFFNRYGKSTSDYFELVRLDPSYRIVHRQGVLDAPAGREACEAVFEQREPGSSQFLHAFLDEARYKYETGMSDFVRRPSLRWSEFFDLRLLKAALRLDMLTPLEKIVYRGVRDEVLRQWLCFPVLFLGAKPSRTPALYSLMNHADIDLGTWYPMGGMFRLFEAMYQLALEKGVEFHFNAPVSAIKSQGPAVTGLVVDDREHLFDAVIAAADYHHVDSQLLGAGRAHYTERYWQQRELAPSSLIYYLGVGKKLDGLLHHNLFFDADFDRHATSIYDEGGWPEDPLFYVCAPSKTDPSVAPAGKENLFILIPLAPGIHDTPEARSQLYNKVMHRIESRVGESIRPHIEYKMEMGPDDFVSAYNSFKGNAYGLANTLRQTAVLKPSLRHRRMKGLYYAGQLSHPGPGLPPSLISGQISAGLVTDDLQ